MRLNCLPSTSRFRGVNIFPESRSFRSSGEAKNLYDILGINREASSKEIKAAYYELSKLHHPDTSIMHKEEAAKKFQEISEAYEILSNQEKRKEYDRKFIRKRASSIQSSRYWSEYPFRDFDRDYPPDFDMDYKSFVEFRRKWRTKQKMSRQWHAPPEYWSESYRHYEAFYPLKEEKRKQQWKDDEYMKFMDEAIRVSKEYKRPEYREVPEQQKDQEPFKSPSREDLANYRLQQEQENLKQKLGVTLVVTLSLGIILMLTAPR